MAQPASSPLPFTHREIVATIATILMTLGPLVSLLTIPYDQSMPYMTTWHVRFGLFGFNPYLQGFALFLLIVGIVLRLLRRSTGLVNLAFYIALIGVAFPTLHGGVLQLILPIPLPENPFDTLLIANYTISILLAFALLPLGGMYLLGDFDASKLGLQLPEPRGTAKWTLITAIISFALYPLPDLLLGRTGGPPWTLQGLILWLIFVGWIATWMQMLFYQGILFARYVDTDGWPLLFLISFIVIQLHIPRGLPPLDPIAAIEWTLTLTRFVLSWGIQLWLIIRTRTLYGALTLASLGVMGNTLLWIL